MDEFYDARERLNMSIGPEAEILWTDPASRFDRRRLGNHQSCPAHRAAAEMNEVPIVCHAVLAGVLAHGRNENAIAEGDTPNGERIEESVSLIGLWHCVRGPARPFVFEAQGAHHLKRRSPCANGKGRGAPQPIAAVVGVAGASPESPEE